MYNSVCSPGPPRRGAVMHSVRVEEFMSHQTNLEGYDGWPTRVDEVEKH